MRTLVFASFAVLLTACGSAHIKNTEEITYRPLPLSSVGKMKVVDVVVGKPQPNVIAEPDLKNGRAGGAQTGNPAASLIVAGILAMEKARAVNESTAGMDVALQPLRESLQSADLRGGLVTAIETERGAVPWLARGAVTVVPQKDTLTDEQYIGLIEGDAVLLVNFGYALLPNFRAVRFTAYAGLYPKSIELRALQRALYRDSRIGLPGALESDSRNSLYHTAIEYQVRLDADADDRASSARLWAENDARRFRAAVDQGAAVIAKVMMSEVQHALEIDPSNSEQTFYQQPYSLEIRGKRYRVSRLGDSVAEVFQESTEQTAAR